MEDELIEIFLSEENTKLTTKKKFSDFLSIIEYAEPNFFYITPKKAVNYALKLQGYNEKEIKRIKKDAKMNDQNAKKKINKALLNFHQKFIKVKLKYSRKYPSLINVAYIEIHTLISLMKEEGGGVLNENQ
ncbi:MAG: hypothetical protein ACP5L4_01935 [Thermoplasmata archaeon]